MTGAATTRTAQAPAETDGDSRQYLQTLAAELVDECADIRVPVPHEQLAAVGNADRFDHAIGAYEAAAAAVAVSLGARFQPAQPYRSMEEFWRDADAQAAGASRLAYWDSYENGDRRRTEKILAEAFGSEHAVLVNAGMSAIDVVVRCSGLRPGDRVLLHHRQYFETTTLLEAIYAQWGVQLCFVDMRDAEALREALIAHTPSLVLVEPVVNGPDCDIPVIEPLLAAGSLLVVDISAVSHSIRPTDLVTGDDVVYVESGMKFLTRSTGVGVIYGWSDWIDAARSCARQTGQQLQGRAVHWLRRGEIRACRQRLALHGARRRRFVAVLKAAAPELYVCDATTGLDGRNDMAAVAVRGANGCTVFVRLPDLPGTDPEQLHRRVVALWAADDQILRVRAGFGWSSTIGRAYGQDALNSETYGSFIRISVGIEPDPEIDAMAMRLAQAAQHVIEECAK